MKEPRLETFKKTAVHKNHFGDKSLLQSPRSYAIDFIKPTGTGDKDAVFEFANRADFIAELNALYSGYPKPEVLEKYATEILLKAELPLHSPFELEMISLKRPFHTYHPK